MVVGAYSREFLSVFVVFCLQINAPIRLQTDRSDASPTNEHLLLCSAQTLLEREREREKGKALFYALSTLDGVFDHL